MATDFDPRTAPTETKTETVVHADATPSTHTAQQQSTHSTIPGQTIKTSTTTRPTGFAHTPAAKLPSFTTQHPPEGSNIGRYISIVAIILLVILLMYQVISKGGMRSQIHKLESEKAALSTQVAQLQKEVENLQLAARQTPATTSNPGSTTQPVQTTNPPGTLSLLSYPVLYRENNYQKIAQTVSVTSTAQVSGVFLRGRAGKGSSGQLTLYENPDLGRLGEAKVVGRRSFDTGKIPADQNFLVQFQSPVELRANTRYVLVVETTKKDAEGMIAYRASTPTAPGTMWVYSRSLAESGAVLSQDFTWQEIPGFDLFFELRGAE